ncbi:MAG: hypothetical protein MJ064_05485 [Lachnospiraceae bacterium]|nr:hypothetical protein [Lachnospiraceae bacterium]
MENFSLDKIKKFFPLVDKAVDSTGLVTCIICYLIVAVIGGVIIKFIPFVGWILGIILELWFIIGIVLAVYTFLKAQSGSGSGQ